MSLVVFRPAIGGCTPRDSRGRIEHYVQTLASYDSAVPGINEEAKAITIGIRCFDNIGPAVEFRTRHIRESAIIQAPDYGTRREQEVGIISVLRLRKTNR